MQILEERVETSPEDRYMTVKEISNRTGLPYRSLLKATRTGHLRSVCLSPTGQGPKFITEKDLNDYLVRASQVTVATAQAPAEEASHTPYVAASSKNRSHSFELYASSASAW